jgi:hypothetical protein
MGRPAASDANKRLAVEFANLVTVRKEVASSTIARCGRYSIYAIFRSIIPNVARDMDKGPRDGISEVEFNKVLQVFIRIRR